ncbi:hypothetical protein NKJ70_17305 [Mesorhizobium sp. M0092]|uniref:hypothetical protein n=1 Tax=unclassified Mesorhizobium TaxID=325217 RepID=UPI003336743A
MLTGCGLLFACRRLFPNGLLAAFLRLVLGLFGLSRSGLLVGWKWLGLWESRRRLLVLLILPLARIALLVVVCRGNLLGRLFSRCGFLLLLVALLPALLQLLLNVVRGRSLLGRLFSRCGFLLLLVALLPARLELLLIVARGRSLLGRLFSRCGFPLLLVALLPARLDLLIVIHGCSLLGRLFGFDLLLLPLFPALIALLLSARGRELFGGRGFGLLLLALVPARLLLGLARLFGGCFGSLLPFAPLAGLLFRLRLPALGTGFGRLAFGAIRLRRDKHCAVPSGAECGAALQRERA